MLRPHHSKVLKPFKWHSAPAEVLCVYDANSVLTAQPDAVDAVNEARQRRVEMLEQRFMV